jgi:hypothetical protein
MADQFDEFLNEVEQDIRQERFEKLWQQYGKVVLVAVSSVLVLVGLYTMWTNYEEKKRLQISEAFVSAQNLLDAGKTDEAIHSLKSLSKSGNRAYETLSQFTLGGIRSTEGPYQDFSEALDIYKNLAQNPKLDNYQRDFAKIKIVAITLQMQNQKLTSEEASPLIKELDSLSAPDAPWRLMALELKGHILSDMGEIEAAREVFIQIAQDAKTPRGMASRAQIISRNLGSKE